MIECVANTRIRDRLLLELDLTLAKATTLALQIYVTLTSFRMAPSATAPHSFCYRCGSTSHLANKQPKPHAIHVAKEVHEVLINELTVLHMNDAAQDKMLCTVHADANEHCHDV